VVLLDYWSKVLFDLKNKANCRFLLAQLLDSVGRTREILVSSSNVCFSEMRTAELQHVTDSFLFVHLKTRLKVVTN
jgi:hypothetical protein